MRKGGKLTSAVRPLSVDVSDEEYRKFGSSIETAVRNEEKYGGNFFVQPEFSHHLHCVVGRFHLTHIIKLLIIVEPSAKSIILQLPILPNQGV